MKKWKLVSSAGLDLGTFEAETEDEALDALARDAGYKSQADVEAQGLAPWTGQVVEIDEQPVDEWTGDWVGEPVPPRTADQSDDDRAEQILDLAIDCRITWAQALEVAEDERNWTLGPRVLAEMHEQEGCGLPWTRLDQTLMDALESADLSLWDALQQAVASGRPRVIRLCEQAYQSEMEYCERHGL